MGTHLKESSVLIQKIPLFCFAWEFPIRGWKALKSLTFQLKWWQFLIIMFPTLVLLFKMLFPPSFFYCRLCTSGRTPLFSDHTRYSLGCEWKSQGHSSVCKSSLQSLLQNWWIHFRKKICFSLIILFPLSVLCTVLSFTSFPLYLMFWMPLPHCLATFCGIMFFLAVWRGFWLWNLKFRET